MSGKTLKIRVTMDHASAVPHGEAHKKTGSETPPRAKSSARYMALGVALCTLAIAGWLTFSSPEKHLTVPTSNELNNAALSTPAVTPPQAIPPAPPLLSEAAVADTGIVTPKSSLPTAAATPHTDTPIAKSKSTPTKAPARASASSKNVKRAILTTKVKQHEPMDRLGTTIKAKDAPRELYFFTEIVDLKGSSVTHRWKHDGKIVASRNFRLDSQSYRVYSNQRMQPTEKGAWQVEVLDSNGKTLSVADFRLE